MSFVATAFSTGVVAAWKATGDRFKQLLEDWKVAPRADRTSEQALWKRFSHARSQFDKHRRQYFARLDAERSDQNPAHKLPRRQHGQRRVEGQHQHRIDARRGQQPEAHAHRRQQLERVLRTQKLIRMRVEGDGNRMHA